MCVCFTLSLRYLLYCKITSNLFVLLTYCLGKPSNISLENNVDWVPSRNLNNLDAVQQCDYNQDALDSSENAPSIYNIAYNSTDNSNITASPDECIGNNPLAKTKKY